MKYLYILTMLLFYSYCKAQSDCNPNIDSKYNRIEILNKISDKLNNLKSHYNIKMPNNFNIVDQNQYNFFIYDLLDTKNKTPNREQSCIEFENEHVYHIASLRTTFKVSIIMVLVAGKCYFFEGVNCTNKINSIAEVLNFVKSNTKNTDEILINNIKNFKNFDLSFSVDVMGKTPSCELN